jgi:hypothetical protein
MHSRLQVHETPGRVTLTGRLGGGTLMGSWCAWLTDARGVRTDVAYPDGWQVKPNPVRLIDPAASVVAVEGDVITVSGPEQVGESMCGPNFFVADKVIIPPSSSASP